MTEIPVGRPDGKIIYTGASKRGWHRLQQAAECLQKYAWTYGVEEDGSDKPNHDDDASSPSLIKGSLVHLTLTQHYARMQQMQTGKDPDEFIHPIEAVELIAQVVGGVVHVADVLKTYEKYVALYHNDHNTMRILGVEILLETRIRGKYLLTGRMDLVYEDLVGQIWVMDHKTTGRLQASHKEYYSASGQLVGYRHLAQTQYGDQLAGVQLNLIEHGGKKFQRLPLPRSPFFEDEFEQTVVDIEENIERLQATKRPIDKWPKAMNEMTCYGRYGACKYLGRCRWGLNHNALGNWTWTDDF
jgi:hypothetical protein